MKTTHAYYYQCQLQLYVTERKYFDFVVWTAKPDMYIERIALDNDLIPMMTANAIKFFQLCVLPELFGKWHTQSRTLVCLSNSQCPSAED